jgi:hypothetical protein
LLDRFSILKVWQIEKTDFTVAAFRVVQEAIREPEQPQPKTTDVKNPNAVVLGRLGGLKGGKAREAALTNHIWTIEEIVKLVN